MHHTKLNKALFLLVSTALLGGLLTASSALAEEEELNRIVLRVNDEILTLYDFEQRKQSELSAILANPNLAPAERQAEVAKVSKDVTQQVFREMLLESFARQNGITVSERDVDDSVRRIQEQQGLASTQELLRALEDAGMSLEQLRANLRQEMLLSSVVRREVSSKIEVSDDELRAYYRNHPEEFQVAEERKLREVIFLDESGLSSEELVGSAEKLLASISAGSEFEQAVAEFQDQGVATGVIDLDWVKADDLEQDLADAAFSTQAGSYSTPTRAKGGIHVVLVEEIKEGFVQPFAEVQDLISARERNRRFGPELRKFMASLENRSHIVENLPSDAVGFRSLAEDYDPESELRDFRAPLGAPSPSEPADADESAEEAEGED